jgi:hypothetical protein
LTFTRWCTKKPKPMAILPLLLHLLWEASPWARAGAATAAVVLVWLAAWTLEWAWWTPRRLDRALRAQGLKGTRYRLLTGDVRENARLNREARTKPLPLGSHDIIPRVLPMFHNAVKENGNFFVSRSLPTSKIYSFCFKLLKGNHLLRFFYL